MVKKVLIFICLYLFSINCYCQDLKISLTPVISNEYVYLKMNGNREKVSVPYLLISYENNCNTDIYFKKIVEDDAIISLPTLRFIIMIAHTLQSFRQSRTKIFKFKNQTKRSMASIFIGTKSPRYFINDTSGLHDPEVFKLVSQLSMDHSTLFLHDISILKEILQVQSYLNTNSPDKQLSFFDYPQKQTVPFFELQSVHIQIPDSELINNKNEFRVECYKNRFAFLKKSETFTQRVNILPLYLIGGTYSFNLGMLCFNNKIMIQRPDPEKFYTTEEITLPDKIDQFHLYSGAINTDGCTIVFEKEKGLCILGSPE